MRAAWRTNGCVGAARSGRTAWGDRDGLAIARLDWRWVARGRLGGPVHAELRVYLLGDEDGRFDLRLTEGERAALDADIRDWLTADGVLDASGDVIGGDWL